MAEFQDVMKQWRRMCANIPCKKCEIYDFCEGFPCLDSDRIEGIVTRWDAEHPEPVYPTWFEWLKPFGVVEVTKDKAGLMTVMVRPEMLNPIPADIAHKLGIEPKEE